MSGVGAVWLLFKTGMTGWAVIKLCEEQSCESVVDLAPFTADPMHEVGSGGKGNEAVGKVVFQGESGNRWDSLRPLSFPWRSY